jgi:glyoxylase-like metal-dependent hydrolase (beta-lactamase superfamily II)
MIIVEQLATRSFSLLSYILRDDRTGRCLIIDPPANIASRVRLNDLDLEAVINTHTHPDHTLGNPRLSGRAPILAHKGEDQWFLKGYNNFFSFAMTGRMQPKISFTLSEDTPLVLGDTFIQVIHTPGHSPGSICLFWPGNLIAGDTVFVQGVGRTDIPGGNPSLLKDSIRKIMELPGSTMVWPGHSYGGTRATLDQIRPMLEWVVKTL